MGCRPHIRYFMSETFNIENSACFLETRHSRFDGNILSSQRLVASYTGQQIETTAR
jgi:hypothetical protein